MSIYCSFTDLKRYGLQLCCCLLAARWGQCVLDRMKSLKSEATVKTKVSQFRMNLLQLQLNERDTEKFDPFFFLCKNV